MKVAIVDTYYPAFMTACMGKAPTMGVGQYVNQLDGWLDQCFGTSDFYSRHLTALGHDSRDFIVNCEPLQLQWAEENGVKRPLSLCLPRYLFQLPCFGRRLNILLGGLIDVAVEQIKAYAPDVLYCQDINFFPPKALAELRKHVGLLVGQIASPLPSNKLVTSYDLILTSFPHFVPRLREMGVASGYFRIGFDSSVLDRLGSIVKDVDVSFVGGVSANHGKALPVLESLAMHTPITFFGYGANELAKDSPILPRHQGEVWGLEMYRALARSRITVNRHINVAENNANNMRLYEATGVGTMLLTDRKDNLGELFEIGKEVIAYSSPEEAAELIQYYIRHPEEAAAIGRAGQQRTLREHTYRRRMEELIPLLKHHLAIRGI